MKKRKIIKEYNVSDVLNRSAPMSWQSAHARYPYGAINSSEMNKDYNFVDQKREEKNNTAPKLFPYPLDNIINNLVDVYEGFGRVRYSLKSALDYPNLSEEERNVIKREYYMVEKIVQRLKLMSRNIEELKF